MTHQTINDLVEIMRQLRDKEQGCPWDIQQNFSTIAPYTIEEAYEVADAIERGNREDLCKELGDLLLQVVFHAQMAAEEGSFTFEDVVTAICKKMIDRHPHVFGEKTARSAEEQTQAWETYKAAERQNAGHSSILDDIPRSLPSLMRADKIQKRVAHIGFDWQHIEDIYSKIEEEWQELREAIASGNQAHIAEEWGDLAFVLVNLARRTGIKADAALHAANAKFERRFRAMEHQAMLQGTTLAQETLEQMETRWIQVKLKETK